MAWIEVHQELLHHPKNLALAYELRLPEYATAGLLVGIWTWALQYAQSGEITEDRLPVVARWIGWRKSPVVLFDALHSCGLMEDGAIHDWDVYAGRLIAKRRANADRMRDARATHGANTNVARAGATNQPTEPYLTEPTNQPADVPAEAAQTATKYLVRLRREAPRTFEAFSLIDLFEIAKDEELDPASAARMFGDVWEWWRTAKRRWKDPRRGWRNWCRKEVERRATSAPTNGSRPPPFEVRDPLPEISEEEREAGLAVLRAGRERIGAGRAE